MTPVLAVDHLTLLGAPPPDFVDLAAGAGFDAVGLRVHPATRGELPYPMVPGAPMVAQTARRLAATGLAVLDTEAMVLDGTVDREVWLPVLEVSAALGARFTSVIVADPEPARAVERLAELVEDALPQGIRPSVEPITYQVVNDIPAAAELVRSAPGAGVVIDALHWTRFGGTAGEVAALGDLLSWVQVCDGPSAAPVDVPRPQPMPAGQSIEGSDLQAEARAVRALPGEGEFALRALLAAAGPATPVAVETPNVARAQAMGAGPFLASAFSAAARLLGRPA